MAQTAKFIDITKTFVPVDPNSFPETLTVPGPDASPEERIPAMAYKGYNFMPTPYGYKSYFGVNQTLSVDALTGNVDEVFVFQNALLENVLVALTDTGVWIKKGTAAGAWTHPVIYAAPTVGQHLLWTHVIIADKLYVYQQGRPSYWLVDNHLTLGVTLVEKTPNFLAMTFQVGIFRAAGRLAFWDVTDSIGWANLDNFTDFEPSLETLAGNASFSDVQGRIITVLSHGEGFVIYSTKSIVYIAQDTSNLYQWKPAVIFPSTGIQYPRQAAVASPDTLHFAYTTEGLKKITLARPETIVPEITDFLKDSTVPVYLKVLEGRFLFLEMMNGEYIVGKLQHGENSIPDASYQFDGSNYNLATVTIPGDAAGICPIIDGISDGEYTNVQPGGANSPTAAPTSPPPHPTAPNYKPVWTCYISNNGVKDPGNIQWGPAPCPTVGPNGKEVNMCPTGLPKVEDFTQTAAGKHAVTGAEAYIDGKWTMERFMAVQGAIWEAEQIAADATIAAILARAGYEQKISTVSSCTNTQLPLIPAICYLGRYPSKYSDAKFGYNSCSFWMTRYLLEAKDINRKMTNSTGCAADTSTDLPGTYAVLTPTAQTNPGAAIGTVQPIEGPLIAIAQAAIAARQVADTAFSQNMSYSSHTLTGGSLTPAVGMKATLVVSGTTTDKVTGNPIHVTPVGLAQVDVSIICPIGYTPYMSGGTGMCRASAAFQRTDTMAAWNEGVDAPIAPIAETAFCQITGWTYDDAEGTEQTIDATQCSAGNGGAIQPPSSSAAPSGQSGFNKAPMGGNTNIPVDPANGKVCGQGTDGFTIDGELITWPGGEVIIPASGFLFSLGSYAPLYPTINGAFVYDLHLKKWGKAFLPYKLLLDYSPINSSAGGIVPTTVFGILGGVLGTDNKIRLFDTSPAASYITYGKVGYYRLGNTSVEEVRVDFRVLSTGSITVDTSLDGSGLNTNLTKTETFVGATSATLYGAYPGRWVNITISGVYDISYLEYRGFTQGRR